MGIFNGVVLETVSLRRFFAVCSKNALWWDAKLNQITLNLSLWRWDETQRSYSRGCTSDASKYYLFKRFLLPFCDYSLHHLILTCDHAGWMYARKERFPHLMSWHMESWYWRATSTICAHRLWANCIPWYKLVASNVANKSDQCALKPLQCLMKSRVIYL